VDAVGAVLHRMAEVRVDVDDVDRTLAEDGVASFHQSFTHALLALETKACQLVSR
jgi:transaldolase